MWASCFRKSLAWMWTAGFAAAVTLPTSGCVHWRDYYWGSSGLPLASAPQPLGASVEAYFDRHQEAGESQDFVIYDHEFYDDSARLTHDGEDHLRQIAARSRNTTFPIIVEQSQTTPKPGTKNEYPIYHNQELDLQRLQVVVRALTMMGVPNAQSRVVIAPALAPGYTSFEGERAYNSGMSGRMGGFGGGSGGGIGGGLGGAFGGGFGGGGLF